MIRSGHYPFGFEELYQIANQARAVIPSNASALLSLHPRYVGKIIMIAALLIFLLITILTWRHVRTVHAYWLLVAACVVGGFPLGIEIALFLLPDRTGVVAGFYLPPAVFALPITIPIAAIALVTSGYILILMPLKKIEGRIRKREVDIPSLGRGIAYVCAGSLIYATLRLSAA